MTPQKTKPAYQNPIPTVDIIIEIKNSRGRKGIILINRKNPPFGWAIPGGFVDYGESIEEAAVREAEEETSLKIELVRQLQTYSDPTRDPRKHTISTVFIATAKGTPRARDDAKDLGIFTRNEIDFPLAFDHEKILADYFRRPLMIKRAPQKTAPLQGTSFRGESGPPGKAQGPGRRGGTK